MEMKSIKSLITFAIGCSLFFTGSVTAAAQELAGSVTVEGDYAPEIILRDRLSSLPGLQPATPFLTELPSDNTSVITDYTADFAPLPPEEWMTQRARAPRGYLDFGIGSFLDVAASAGYRIIDSERTQAGAWLQHNSSSLFTPKGLHERHLLDDFLGLYLSHDFGKGTLTTRGSYHFGRFNYYGAAMFSPDAPVQNLNDAALSALWTSAKHDGSIRWHAGIDWRYFGYWRLYDKNAGAASATRENHISLNGGAALPWDSESTIGVDAALDVLLYSNSPAGNYSRFGILPYYSFIHDKLNIRLGAKIDLFFNAGSKDHRSSVFRIAPDIRLDWKHGIAGLYVHLLGGTRLTTLASGAQLDMYQYPCVNDTRPVYSPLDAAIGAEFGPIAGFSGGISFSYRFTNNTRIGGLYVYGLCNDMTSHSARIPEAWENRLNIHGYSMGAHLDYSYGSLLSFTAKGTWQPQNGDIGYFNGYDRPRWTAGASVSIKPISPLSLTLDYELRGNREIYYLLSPQLPAIPLPVNASHEVCSIDLDNISNLSFGASWSFSARVSVWAQAMNLLNRHTACIPCLPQPGIAFMGGVALTFR